MFRRLVPLNRHEHADLRVRPLDHFRFADRFHIASIMTHEFMRAASVYPIIFLEEQATDGFRPVVLMGLEEGSNLFVGPDGRWRASYVPAIIRRYPFALARDNRQAADQLSVCVDVDSEFVSRSEGRPLFGPEGEPTEVTEHVKRYLGELQALERFTRDCCRLLAEHNLFTPLNMRVRYRERLKNVTGAYLVNEQRLKRLSDSTFSELRSRDYLPAIYAHLTSLAQVERLMMLQDGLDSLTRSEAEQRASDDIPIH